MRFRLLAVGALVLIASLTLGVRGVFAQDEEPEAPPESEQCLTCHAGLNSETTFLNGQTRPIQVHQEELNESVHAERSCVDCHGDYEFPHENEYQSDRDFRLFWTQACERCHSPQSDLANDSVHSEAFTAGNENAAVCQDCHGYHNVHDLSSAEISRTCGNCHTGVFDLYAESVHGEAVLGDNNTDAPTCINCHGVHNIADPTTNLFRVRSPLLCAQCHANEDLMEEYGISTHVFDTYVSDFHGTTVTLFQNQAPDAEVNKAVCYDCHGVHDIKSPDDPDSRVMQENLVATCQRCHPGATADFASAWMGHYEPSADKYPLVFFVDKFYDFFIPGVLGFMGFVVLTDIGRRLTRSLRRETEE